MSARRDFDVVDLDPRLRADFEAVFGALPRPLPPCADSPLGAHCAPARAMPSINPPRADTGD